VWANGAFVSGVPGVTAGGAANAPGGGAGVALSVGGGSYSFAQLETAA
jgi:hypothetical protein